MKNNGKNHSNPESYSAGEAAGVLGVSIPTLKRMASDGQVESFRTPGGHLRILAESIEAVREHRQAQPRPVRDASPVLQNRRERLEELTLEAQELRARRELEKLRREEQEEAERREAEAQVREEEADQRRAELELERDHLEHEQAQAEARLERERTLERQCREAERELAAFRCRCLDTATEALSRQECAWLSASQRKEVLDGLETEIEKRQPADEPRMGLILARTLEGLVEPFRAERKAQERRQSVTERALWNLACSATDAEKVRATAAIREALRQFDAAADEREMRVAAEEAVRPVKQATERRVLDARVLNWAIRELPWPGRSDRDEARLRRECAEILADLPIDVSEAEAKEALEPTVSEARQEIEARQARKQREQQKVSLIQEGVAEVLSYLWRLKHDEDISSDDYWSSEFRANLTESVKEGLERDLSGEETSQEVKELVHEIIDSELE